MSAPIASCGRRTTRTPTIPAPGCRRWSASSRRFRRRRAPRCWAATWHASTESEPEGVMDFEIPADIQKKLAELDEFIEREIKPLERDNMQYFDHRREWARTDWEHGGVPRREWEELLAEMRRRADKAGHLRYALPKDLGGQDASNLAMAIVREHLAAKGLGLHNDLQNEASIVGNFPTVHMMRAFGTEAQKKEFLEGMITGTHRLAFGLTEPGHGSDATWLETQAVRRGDAWVINGRK